MMDLLKGFDQDSRFRIRAYFLEKSAMAAPGVYWNASPLPGYSTVLPGSWFYFSQARVHVNSGLFTALDSDRPDIVVVMGYSELTCQVAMYWLWLRRVPWVFWGEVPGFERRQSLGGGLRWLAQRPLAWMADGIAGIGSRAADAYRQIAKAGCRVWNVPYYCDIESFLAIPRTSAGADHAHFLYCGQLVPRKGVDLLVRAFCRLAAEHPTATLTLVGDGPLRATLAASIPEAMRDRVEWAGFKEVEDLPLYFARANVFVLPSVHDGWGVVINQAVAAGMPVIASSAVGAALDLVEPDVNGLRFPPQDEESLLGAMRRFARQPGIIPGFGQASRDRAWRLHPSVGVEEWHRICRVILGRKHGASRMYHEIFSHHTNGSLREACASC